MDSYYKDDEQVDTFDDFIFEDITMTPESTDQNNNVLGTAPVNTPVEMLIDTTAEQKTGTVEEMIAADIAAGKIAPRLAFDQILAQIIATQYYQFPGTTVTVCCLTLQNGYNTTGVSACISEDNFNADIGKKIARDNAIQDIWMLEGYLLKEQLSSARTLDTIVGDMTVGAVGQLGCSSES